MPWLQLFATRIEASLCTYTADRNGRARHRHRTRESLEGGFHAMDGIKALIAKPAVPSVSASPFPRADAADAVDGVGVDDATATEIWSGGAIAA